MKVGNEFRCLQHFPSLDRPVRRLPWPFSRLQPFRFDITRQTFPPGDVVAGVQFPSKGPGGPKTKIEYNQTQIDEAIEALLDGCRPDGPIPCFPKVRVSPVGPLVGDYRIIPAGKNIDHGLHGGKLRGEFVGFVAVVQIYMRHIRRHDNAKCCGLMVHIELDSAYTALKG